MKFGNFDKNVIRKMEAGDYEAGFFGKVDTEEMAYRKALEKVKKPSKEPEKLKYYVSYDNSLNLARNFQPRDLETGKRLNPANPKSELLRELRVFLLNILQKYDCDDDSIKAYTAVGTPADFIHGVDAFIDIENQTVTLDITLRKGKEGKADIIIDDKIPDPQEDEDGFLKQVDKIAEKIYQKLDKKSLRNVMKKSV
jgi:hypothetical protein